MMISVNGTMRALAEGTTVAELVASVPCFHLDFRRDPGFWEVITHD